MRWMGHYRLNFASQRKGRLVHSCLILNILIMMSSLVKLRRKINKRPSMQRHYKVSSHYETNQSNFRSHFKYLGCLFILASRVAPYWVKKLYQCDRFLRPHRSIVLMGETYVRREAHERCLFSMDA